MFSTRPKVWGEKSIGILYSVVGIFSQWCVSGRPPKGLVDWAQEWFFGQRRLILTSPLASYIFRSGLEQAILQIKI